MLLEKMTRSDMEIELINEDSLYAMFDEARLNTKGGYSDEEMRAVIQKWIELGNEAI